jgi:ankyrin repeat protein
MSSGQFTENFDRMTNDRVDATASQSPASEEPQAPPYVLHPRPLQSGDEIEDLPLYTEHHDPNAPIDIRELDKILLFRNRAIENDMKLWRRYLDNCASGKQTDRDREIAKPYIRPHFFSAIERGQEDVIALLIENHFVTANTQMAGTTPLLMAVLKKNVSVAKQLLNLGADPNEFGSLARVSRRNQGVF